MKKILLISPAFRNKLLENVRVLALPPLNLMIIAAHTPAEYEVALAAALGERIEALVTADAARGLELLEWLKERDLGRVTALAMHGLEASPQPRCDLEDPAISGRLSDVLTAAPEVAALIRTPGHIRQ